MCARFYRLEDLKALAARFKLQVVQAALLEAQYNLAPTDPAYVIPATEARSARAVEIMKFGMANPWVPNGMLINMRAENFAMKTGFRKYLQHRRCLIPADGFFEWKKDRKGSQPYKIGLTAGEMFGIAGVYEDGRFAIITTEPNAILSPIHDRMPVVLRREEEDLWLDAGVTARDQLVPLLSPFAASAMTAVPVSKAVNSAKNKGPEVLR